MRPLLACSSLLFALCVASSAWAGVSSVGSPTINRSNNDSSVGIICLYRGVSQPAAGPGSITQWSFFDNESNGKVTPLLFEVTGASQWKIVAIGTTRTSTAGGVQSNSFSVIAGSAALQAGKQYTIGFTHRGYTGSGGNVTPDGGSAGVVDFDGYSIYTDTWSYAIATASVGLVLGTGGTPVDSLGFGGRIYSASFAIDNNPSTPVTYCTAGTSTNGCVPSISGTGSPSVAAPFGFTIHVASVEGAKQGLVFYGVSGRLNNTPWATGSTSFLCVKSPTQRMTLASSGGTSGQCNGAFHTDWLAFLAANPTALGAPFSAGVTVDAQAWYRDPAAVKTTSLSNGLEFTTVP
jgi:hypothetical protein